MTGAALNGWRLAVGTLTIAPISPPARVDRQVGRWAMLLAPFAVLPVAIAAALTTWLALTVGLPSLVAALLALGVQALGTRAMHLDGLSDTADGLAASFDRERSLEVMKTGTSGPAGTATMLLVLALQAASASALFAGTRPWLAALLTLSVICVSRGALLLACLPVFLSARPGGLGATVAGTIPLPAALLMWLFLGVIQTVVTLWASWPWWQPIAAVGLAVAATMVLLIHTRRRFGGVTGDVLGACIEVCLTALLIGLLVTLP